MNERLTCLLHMAARALDEHLDELRSTAGVDVSRAVALALQGPDGLVHITLGTPAFVADTIDQATAPTLTNASRGVRASRKPLAIGCVVEPGGQFIRVRELVVPATELPS